CSRARRPTTTTCRRSARCRPPASAGPPPRTRRAARSSSRASARTGARCAPGRTPASARSPGGSSARAGARSFGLLLAGPSALRPGRAAVRRAAVRRAAGGGVLGRGRVGRQDALGDGPAAQLVRGGLLADDAAVQAQVEQEAVRLADEGAGLDAEDLLDLVAVDLRADRGELLLLLQPRDAPLEVVIGAAEPFGLAPVAGGAVGAGQLVQPRQQVPGVADVAADGRVGPLAG